MAVNPLPFVREADGAAGQEQEEEESDGAEQEDVHVEHQVGVADRECSCTSSTLRGRCRVGHGSKDGGSTKDRHCET